ncbi:16S rRNA (cytosine(967)-C(5))-methyltransferase RsmB [Paenibacillus senegalensis]|uniref:16S rRNA (cytosine(967)-C(5))-methyltransferase RsmB n=1 Tax=Paenibacillus senegalensis TaxID=1465766 RepID=UPI000289B1EB|nr:16S rRNA (cytosine(967)-C(5))-methyltransferase RsmB [Paenibacillus senegalensis]
MKSSRAARTPANARHLAVELLTRVEAQKAYSNLLLDKLLKQSGLERLDAAFATELVYGTLQHQLTIDYYLQKFVAKGWAKLEPWVRNLLRISFYQLYYLDRVPAHAAINEAVELAKRLGHRGISGMVNGVLRNVERQKASLEIPDSLPLVKRLSLTYSHPEWMIKQWLGSFGEEETARICQANNEPPHASIRVSPGKRTREQLLAELQEQGIDASPSPLSAAGIVVRQAGNMADTDGYREGLFTIQDESSMLVGEAVDPRPGMSVLDCCAAPGGKTTHMAELMNDQGMVIGCDIHEHKEALIRKQAQRLGLTSIQTLAADARTLSGRFPAESFDRVLLDAPCSGLGVIRRKPDLKWAKEPNEVKALSRIQAELLEAVHPLVKPGGLLVYSTCTIAAEENEEQIRRFLLKHPQFTLSAFPSAFSPVEQRTAAKSSGMLQLLPHHYNSDGFFICRLQKA